MLVLSDVNLWTIMFLAHVSAALKKIVVLFFEIFIIAVEINLDVSCYDLTTNYKLVR